MATDVATQLEAIDTGDQHIAEDDFGLVQGDLGEPGFAIFGFDASPASAEERLIELPAEVCVAVDDENGSHVGGDSIVVWSRTASMGAGLLVGCWVGGLRRVAGGM